MIANNDDIASAPKPKANLSPALATADALVVDPTDGPVADPAVDSAADPVVDPAADPVVDPAADPVVDPAAKSPPQEPVAFSFSAPAVIAACQTCMLSVPYVAVVTVALVSPALAALAVTVQTATVVPEMVQSSSMLTVTPPVAMELKMPK
jgi:ribonuclease E